MGFCASMEIRLASASILVKYGGRQTPVKISIVY